MPTPCIFCSSPQRAELEAKIVAHTITQAQAAKILSCGPASVQRHMANHAPESLQKSIELRHVDLNASLDVAKELTRSHSDCLQLFKEALRAGNVREALRALEVEVKQLTLAGKLSGMYSDAPTVTLLTSPSFVQVRKLIVESLADHPEKLADVAGRIDEILQDYGTEQ